MGMRTVVVVIPSAGAFFSFLCAGRRQAHCLAQRLGTERITAILCSPYSRTIETSTPLSQVTGVRICCDDALAETHGAERIPPPSARFPFFPTLDLDYHGMITLPRDEEEEFPRAFFTRLHEGVRGLEAQLRTSGGGQVVLVTHAACCVAMVGALLRVRLEAVAKAGACSVSTVRLNLPVVLFLNERRVIMHAGVP